MSQGAYVRTKHHREEFAKNMHSPTANKRRQETRQKNKEKLGELKDFKLPIISSHKSDTPVLLKDDDKSDKYDHSANHIKNMSRGKCEDELASVRYEILSKVQRLSDMWKSLIALQEKREKLEIRLEETGVNFKD